MAVQVNDITIEIKKNHSIGRFNAMACPCEILLETLDKELITLITKHAYNEAKRIENKFSRYRTDNIIYAINNSNGTPVDVDDETTLMFNFADQCFELTDGKFDITSGVLRKIWQFDGSDNIPTQEQVNEIIPKIGWKKAIWNPPSITLPNDMEVDLGGIGKEYAVDSTAKILNKYTDHSFLINFGGDIACNKPRKENTPWTIGVDNPEHTGEKSAGKLALYNGGLATSGDARRYLIKNRVRYSHILDPKTGHPIPDAPRSVTVIANTCIEAGMISTFAMLHGKDAVDFLEAQNVKYWCIP
ncbi:MAG: FAD:protein FMN transferase [endosymbiont of Galathealinum brachiosum]|uniref:FAD:protein FMN transferase n=1 Tax=endosymbiont of Galathealinum brachiosum TaxID=2200906 RepID=A0A370DAB8_9GAMM|nr:MAG: FAD:protein FMN transferase [endosymbiont of Galathealinum brachiosum]